MLCTIRTSDKSGTRRHKCRTGGFRDRVWQIKRFGKNATFEAEMMNIREM
jgi:hypothetical protein